MDDSPEALAILSDQITSIRTAMNEDYQYTALAETDLLLKTLTPQFIKDKKLDDLQKLISTILRKPEYNRILRMNQRIKIDQETALEYYDEDIGTDERLFYQKDLEKDLIKANERIREFLAILIKSKFNDEITFD